MQNNEQGQDDQQRSKQTRSTRDDGGGPLGEPTAANESKHASSLEAEKSDGNGEKSEVVEQHY